MMVSLKRRLANAGVLAVLAVGSVATAAPAFADSGTGASTNGCFGKWYNKAWAQHCDGGATATGYFKTVADCSAPQIPDNSLEKYRYRGSKAVYNGADCGYGINRVLTYYRTA